MKKNIIIPLYIASLFVATNANAAAQMWCLKDTTECAYGTPSGMTTAQRTALLYKMTVGQFATSVLSGTFKPVTPTALRAKAIAPTPAPTPTPTPSPIVQKELMPAVDTRLVPVPIAGYSDLRVRPTGQQAQPNEIGAFRVTCGVSHMNFDDPMVFPNQPNATHHHMYYGHTDVKHNTNLMTLADSGNSTCHGGIMNRSAYWHPTLIDIRTNAPVMPDGNGAMFYYKTGYGGVAPRFVTPPPRGLRILTGNPRATNANEVQKLRYACVNPSTGHATPRTPYIQNCAVGQRMLFEIFFPQCWDGKNLDSPNHKDHMADATGSRTPNGCPVSHPVPIPEISLNIHYTVTQPNQATNWRLSSDNYAFNGSNAGYSGHADWVNGWNEAFFAGVVRNCLNPSRDCAAHLLGDGRMYYGVN
jgi:hypothetical protein